MSLIELQKFVAAPPERCFDLSRSVDLHLESAAGSGERVVSGRASGLLVAGDTVTWEARHLGLRHRLSVWITEYDRPRMFRDEMIEGPFRRMRHDHWFDAVDGGTRMRDAFEFASWIPPLDVLLVAPHLRRLLRARAELIQAVAESDRWRRFLGGATPRHGARHR
jgi:ligand-binding SRPBCC domain-containing protein